jgi:hypothetical protein
MTKIDVINCTKAMLFFNYYNSDLKDVLIKNIIKNSEDYDFGSLAQITLCFSRLDI